MCNGTGVLVLWDSGMNLDLGLKKREVQWLGPQVDISYQCPLPALVKLVYMANLLKIVYKNGSFNSPIFSTLVLL